MDVSICVCARRSTRMHVCFLLFISYLIVNERLAKCFGLFSLFCCARCAVDFILCRLMYGQRAQRMLIVELLACSLFMMDAIECVQQPSQTHVRTNFLSFSLFFSFLFFLDFFLLLFSWFPLCWMNGNGMCPWFGVFGQNTYNLFWKRIN